MVRKFETSFEKGLKWRKMTLSCSKKLFSLLRGITSIISAYW